MPTVFSYIFILSFSLAISNWDDDKRIFHRIVKFGKCQPEPIHEPKIKIQILKWTATYRVPRFDVLVQADLLGVRMSHLDCVEMTMKLRWSMAV